MVQLTPYGIFAIAASTAGTLDLQQLGRIQVFLLTYVVLALVIALWVLPGLVAALTPIRFGEVLSTNRDALITAFMAGDLFIVLPSLIESCKELLGRHGLTDQHARDLPDVIVPASFNFPHTGKLMSLSFILFAGWFADAAVPLADYPKLALTGFLTFFDSLNAAVPFLLDLFRIPADTFQLFLATSVVNSRFGSLIAALHTVAVGLLGSAALVGAVRFDAAKIVLEKYEEQGFDPLYESEARSTLLHYASESDSTELIDLLFRRGVPFDKKNIFGLAPLHIAAMNGDNRVVKFFVEKGLDIDARTDDGRSAYNLACEAQNNEFAEYLKSVGADQGPQRFPVLTGEYMGQPKPGKRATPFSPAIIDYQTPFHSAMVLTPDGNEIFWSKFTGIYSSKRIDGCS